MVLLPLETLVCKVFQLRYLSRRRINSLKWLFIAAARRNTYYDQSVQRGKVFTVDTFLNEESCRSLGNYGK